MTIQICIGEDGVDMDQPDINDDADPADNVADPEPEEPTGAPVQEIKGAISDANIVAGKRARKPRTMTNYQERGTPTDVVAAAVDYKPALSPAEEKFYDAMEKFGYNLNQEVCNVMADLELLNGTCQCAMFDLRMNVIKKRRT